MYLALPCSARGITCSKARVEASIVAFSDARLGLSSRIQYASYGVYRKEGWR